MISAKRSPQKRSANARQCLNNLSATDGTVSITDADSQNDTMIQANNMNNIFTQNPNFLVLNNLNQAATSQIVEQCKNAGITHIHKIRTAGEIVRELTKDLA